MKSIIVTPAHLDWLAGRLGIKDRSMVEPDFGGLLSQLPSGFFEYPANEEVVREGEPGDDLYVIYSGDLAVIRSVGLPTPMEVAKLGPGDIFGEIAYFAKAPRSATVRTTDTAQVFRFRAAEFSAIMKKNPALADTVRKMAQDRLAKTLLTQL